MTKREYFKKLREDAKAARLAEQAELTPNPRFKKRYSFAEMAKGLDKFPRLVTRDQLAQLTQID